MVNLNFGNLSAYNDEVHNKTRFYIDYHSYYYYYYSNFFSICTDLICIFGIFGNGMVIWLLGFQIKRNQFTTYVLNLAIADFGLITTEVMGTITYLLFKRSGEMLTTLFILFDHIFIPMFCTSQHLLTVISMDRCVSVFFPLWHRCHRSRHLSGIACALIWVVSLLPAALSFIFSMVGVEIDLLLWQFVINGFFCLPLMTVSSLMLFLKVCCKSKEQRRRKLLITTLVTVFIFLFLSFPCSVCAGIYYLYDGKGIFLCIVTFCACLNSSVNPFVYYLAGRPTKRHSNRDIKSVLQILFKEEDI